MPVITSAHVAQWLMHSDAMCSGAWHTLGLGAAAQSSAHWSIISSYSDAYDEQGANHGQENGSDGDRWLVAWHSGRTLFFDRQTFPVLDLEWPLIITRNHPNFDILYRLL